MEKISRPRRNGGPCLHRPPSVCREGRNLRKWRRRERHSSCSFPVFEYFMGESPIIFCFFGDAFDRIATFDPFGTDQKKMFPHWRFADPVSPIPLQIALPFSHFFWPCSPLSSSSFCTWAFFSGRYIFCPPISERRRMREWREREPPKKVGGN